MVQCSGIQSECSCKVSSPGLNHEAALESERFTTHPTRKVDPGPSCSQEAPGPGMESVGNAMDLQCSACVRARSLVGAWCARGRRQRPERHRSLHRRGTHAGNTHKHCDNGKQSVYAVHLFASPSPYEYGEGLEASAGVMIRTSLLSRKVPPDIFQQWA